ncbi:unnamed protein product [Nippostrongylus brasiliensis]|uniref:Uncharacterized protein n=1 Tax=Nippostrongylus brasiliensis TaxID=27835 RepID=A0A158QYW2_NIPBR|nr:unnamed protein product [Nippostrongylus brasiliensis]
MSSNVYTIAFVLEKIHQPTERSFDLRLRLDGHDWCGMGEIWTSDLPVGFTFTTILSSFKNAQQFTEVLSSRGLSVLYSDTVGNQVLAVTLAVQVKKYYHQPTEELNIELRQSGTQTERAETRTVQTQVHRRRSTTGSNTELHLLSAAELENTVANVVAEHLREKKPAILGPAVPTDIPTKGILTEEAPLDGKLGKNVVPRLQKLRVLDKMIVERSTLVDRFDANIVKQEIARKKAVIQKARTLAEHPPLKEVKETVTTSAKPQKPRKTLDASTQSEKVASSSSPNSSTTSGTTSVSGESEKSEESETSDESTSEEQTSEETSTESSADSSFSSKETILRRSSIAAE